MVKYKKSILEFIVNVFLNHFNIQKISDLPTIDELGSAGLIDSSNIDSAIFGTEKFYKILNEEISFENGKWKNVSNEAKNFIKSCLQKNADKRISTKEAFSHPWFKSINEEVNSIKLDSEILKNIKNNNCFVFVQIENYNSKNIVPVIKKDLWANVQLIVELKFKS